MKEGSTSPKYQKKIFHMWNLITTLKESKEREILPYPSIVSQ